jgi:hypothetical protein
MLDSLHVASGFSAVLNKNGLSELVELIEWTSWSIKKKKKKKKKKQQIPVFIEGKDPAAQYVKCLKSGAPRSLAVTSPKSAFGHNNYPHRDS